MNTPTHNLLQDQLNAWARRAYAGRDHFMTAAHVRKWVQLLMRLFYLALIK